MTSEMILSFHLVNHKRGTDRYEICHSYRNVRGR